MFDDVVDQFTARSILARDPPVLSLTDDELRTLTAALHAFTGTAWAWATPQSEEAPIVSDFEMTLNALIGTYIRGIHRDDHEDET